MMTDVTFECIHCGQPMEIESTAVGMTVECPSCHQPIVVPESENGLPHERKAVAEAIELESSSLRQQLVDASVHSSRLEGELAEARNEVHRWQAELEALRGQFSVEQNKSQQDRRKLRDDLVALKKELTEREKQAAAYAEAAARLQEQVSGYQTAHAEALQQAEAAQREYRSAVEGLRSQESLIETLRAEAVRLEAELNTVREVAAKLPGLEDRLVAAHKQIDESNQAASGLRSRLIELEKERDSFRSSLLENSTGKDLVETRERLQVAEKARDGLVREVDLLKTENETVETKRRSLDEEVKMLVRELDTARRKAETTSEHHLLKDNEVLRGIIERQNAQLQQQHIQLVRLRRARFGVRLAYIAFAIALVAIAVWALKIIPGVKLGGE
jgi:DNA repair exonuclease SbcCD ATPase subunit